MADNLLKALFDLLDAGYVPGESLSRLQRKLVGLGASLETASKGHVTLSAGNLANAESYDAFFIAPFALEITAIEAVKGTLTGTTNTATLNNRDAAGDADKNPIAGASIDLDALATADEAEAETLNSTQANIEMAAGDALRCTFAANTAIQGAAVLLEYKPIAAVSF